MFYINPLNNIPYNVKSQIFECISDAVSEDMQEADSKLNFKTHVSFPFLKWDLLNRNLISKFDGSNIIFSDTKRGFWEILLMYEPNSKTVISFMRKSRFYTIKNSKSNNRPKYIQSLVQLNDELVAPVKQIALFEDETYSQEFNQELLAILDQMCNNFSEHINQSEVNHTILVFDEYRGMVTSMEAFVLDNDFNVVFEENWLDIVKPMMTNSINNTIISSPTTLSLSDKAVSRLKNKKANKGIVSLKSSNEALDNNT